MEAKVSLLPDKERPHSLIPEAEALTEELRSGPLGPLGLQARKQLCDSGLPDVDMCELTEPGPSYPAVEEAISR